jgi:hypothetical protein
MNYDMVDMKVTIFLDVTSYSPLDIYRRFGGTFCLHLQDRRLRVILTMKMNAVFPPNASVINYGIKRRYVLRDSNVQT